MLQLKLHPDSVCEAVARIDVLLTRQSARLAVRFIVHGNIAALRIPPIIAAHRTDELWQHTCCEMFIRATGDAYYEFNLSPSTQWAAYRFSGYRQGMAKAQVIAPVITVSSDATQLELQAQNDFTQIDFTQIDATPDPTQLSILSAATWRAGLSVVIEEATGRKSYWALAHPQGKPDFHHADGFVLKLEP